MQDHGSDLAGEPMQVPRRRWQRGCGCASERGRRLRVIQACVVAEAARWQAGCQDADAGHMRVLRHARLGSSARRRSRLSGAQCRRSSQAPFAIEKQFHNEPCRFLVPTSSCHHPVEIQCLVPDVSSMQPPPTCLCLPDSLCTTQRTSVHKTQSSRQAKYNMHHLFDAARVVVELPFIILLLLAQNVESMGGCKSFIKYQSK